VLGGQSINQEVVGGGKSGTAAPHQPADLIRRGVKGMEKYLGCSRDHQERVRRIRRRRRRVMAGADRM